MELRLLADFAEIDTMTTADDREAEAVSIAEDEMEIERDEEGAIRLYEYDPHSKCEFVLQCPASHGVSCRSRLK